MAFKIPSRVPSPTGRRSVASNPNIQNVPVRTAEGRAVREAFAPLPGLPRFVPSPYQAAIFDWVVNGRGNCFVEATAGSGKTTTGIEACKLMTHKGKPEYAKWHSVAFVSFNKPIAVEIADKIAKLPNLSYVKVGTFHSFGFKAWVKVYPEAGKNVCLDGEKMDAMHLALATPSHLQTIVAKLISFAKNDAVLLDWQTDNLDRWQRIIDRFELDSEIEDPEELDTAIQLAAKGLLWHREDGKTRLDFDDMLWLPIISNVKVFQHSWVIVDEAQDTNAARTHLARKMGNRWTRYMFVGDENQAINGFTGADTDAVQKLIRDFQCKSLPLTVTYRCPLAVVAKAQQYVQRIEAREGAPEGLVAPISAKAWAEEWMTKLQPDDLVLCRKTAPLISLCFQLIRRGTACRVAGKEIGKGLVALAQRWKTDSVNVLRNRLTTYRDREVAKLKAKKKEAAAEALADRVECLMVLCEGQTSVAAVVEKVNTMFEDVKTGQARRVLTLMTVHKSKGAEAERVFILGFNRYMPSKAARQPEDIQQETNLIFVAVTRAKQELYLVETVT